MEQLGEYLIRRLVGEGGMGRVYEAEERLSKRRVALKVMREELTQSEQARRLFLNEMQILAHLEHPSIVRSLACFEADGRLVSVLEYLDGRTLRALVVERGPLGWPEAVHVVVCVARALAAAHGQTPPVVHRDLKPENIMVLEGGAVKVMDFGIAKLVQELGQTNTQSVGTLQYMSPEQIDAHSIDHRADLYCLGLVLYETLAGHPPFQSASPRALLNMQCTQPPPPLPDTVRAGLPKGVERVLFEMLEKDPARRPAAAADIAERLEPFLPERAFGDIGLGSVSGARGADAPRRDSAEDALGAPRGSTPARGPARSGGEESAAAAASDHAAPKDPGAAGAREGSDTLMSPRADVLGGRAAPTADKGGGGRERGRARTANDPAGARKDTVALIEQASAGREIKPGVALLIIAAMTLAAGLATYLWRTSQSPSPGSPAAAPR